VATEAFVAAMQRAFIIAAIISAVGAVTSLVRGKPNNDRNLFGATPAKGA
jgi:hypothetical protein